MGDEGAQYVAKMTSLTKLNIGKGCLNLESNGLTEVGMKSIASLQNLETLNVSGNIIGPAGAAYLTNLNNLKSLTAIGCIIWN